MFLEIILIRIVKRFQFIVAKCQTKLFAKSLKFHLLSQIAISVEIHVIWPKIWKKLPK